MSKHLLAKKIIPYMEWLRGALPDKPRIKRGITFCINRKFIILGLSGINIHSRGAGEYWTKMETFMKKKAKKKTAKKKSKKKAKKKVGKRKAARKVAKRSKPKMGLRLMARAGGARRMSSIRL